MKNLIIIISIFFAAKLSSFPIRNYDYHIPQNNVSPITAALGGMNVCNINDPGIIYYNPAILIDIKKNAMTLDLSFDPKHDDTFSSILNESNLIEESKINYFSIVTPKGGFSYIPLANFDQKEETADASIRKYQSYYLNAFILAFADRRAALDFGINLKFLQGRLVYLEEERADSLWHTKDFIDDSAIGFSCDLGFYRRVNNFAFGLSLYDVFSKLFWEDSSNKEMKRRYAFGTQLESENGIISSGVSGRLDKNFKRIYHFGYQQNLRYNKLIIPFRIGIFSETFDHAENIFFSLGTGMRVSENFSIDVSFTNNDTQIDNSKYLISFTLNAPRGN